MIKYRLQYGVITLFILFFSGCGEQRHFGKIDKSSYATKSCQRSLSSGKELSLSAQIDKIIVYKKRRKLYTYKKGKKVDTFSISMGKNANKGDKVRQGDYKTPEGAYTIVRKKCDPRLYRSLMISYPNKQDRAQSRSRGLNPGGYITIHGQPKWNADGKGDKFTLSRDWTEGCIAVTNSAMNILWRSVSIGTRIEIHP